MSHAMVMPPVAILAGGLAMRMLPLTKATPKAMLSVADEPFIAHQLRQLRREGVDRVVLCVGHLSGAIRAFVGDGSAFGLSVDYSDEGSQRLGTAGALRHALPLLGGQFLVLYGDCYLPIVFSQLVRAFHASGQPALMSVYANPKRLDRNNVVFRDGMVKFYSKIETRPGMDFIDYGLSMFAAEVIGPLAPGRPCDLAEVIGPLAASGRLAGWEVFERFYEIGSPAGLRDTEDFIREQLRAGI